MSFEAHSLILTQSNRPSRQEPSSREKWNGNLVCVCESQSKRIVTTSSPLLRVVLFIVWLFRQYVYSVTTAHNAPIFRELVSLEPQRRNHHSNSLLWLEFDYLFVPYQWHSCRSFLVTCSLRCCWKREQISNRTFQFIVRCIFFLFILHTNFP